ncbi:MAG: hypothetical protein L6R28_18910 [Planctomycetes bacterium]|nr:hypothetical protein [Planctomycetota bacterium]
MEHLLVVRPDGTVEFIYDDELQPLLEAGDGRVRRASHVEPTDQGHWLADLSQVGGPCLGPFQLRADALAAEVEYLLSHDWNSIVASDVQAASEMDSSPI